MTDLNGCTAGTVAEAANGEERVMGRPAAVTAVTGDQACHATPFQRATVTATTTAPSARVQVYIQT